MISRECAYCKKELFRNKCELKKFKNSFCNNACKNKFYKIGEKITKPCATCGNLVIRFISDFRKNKTGNVFCNSSCSASYNNRTHPKRHFTKICKTCNNNVGYNNLYCGVCSRKRQYLQETKRAKFLSTSGASRYTYIRQMSRKWYLANNSAECVACGYNINIDVAHIISISNFSLDTSIEIINAPNNLIGLCKNCHWEVDHPDKDNVQVKFMKENNNLYLIKRDGSKLLIRSE